MHLLFFHLLANVKHTEYFQIESTGIFIYVVTII